jgi:hypothetical protein
MNIAVAALGAIAAGVVGFLLGKKDGKGLGFGIADASFFTSNHGTDGFCAARILKKKMRGSHFHWMRHGSCKPSNGGYFEIRIKERESPLRPERPRGVDHIYASVKETARAGDVYRYSLWQVLPNGEERELHDPELEIAF